MLAEPRRLAELTQYKAEHGLTSWDSVVEQLLSAARVRAERVTERRRRAGTLCYGRARPDTARQDAVLYEGYLLYPYRATSRKNQVRWQFGVLGPEGADLAGIGEDSHLSMDCLLDVRTNQPIEEMQAALSIHVRFLQLQWRRTEQVDDRGGYFGVPELRVGAERWFSWDEAVEVECSRTVLLADLVSEAPWTVAAEASESIEPVHHHQRRKRPVSWSPRRWTSWPRLSRPGWSPSLACIGSACPSTIRRRSMGWLEQTTRYVVRC